MWMACVPRRLHIRKEFFKAKSKGRYAASAGARVKIGGVRQPRGGGYETLARGRYIQRRRFRASTYFWGCGQIALFDRSILDHSLSQIVGWDERHVFGHRHCVQAVRFMSALQRGLPL
jgi:hypothetical protein